ncbi:MAG: hypothetical protein KatS3mg090_0608 [Patescibacteria group bacterium]|nr:MAG: hypothetical protein KatS3mg090_0608 [Patescibacteria group bacterium]
MSRKFINTGYKLHQKRLQLSQKPVIRSIKYPLETYSKNLTNQELIEKISTAIVKDDLKIRGCVNLNDYYQYYNNNHNFYTIIDFWIDSLKAGVIWQSSGNAIIGFTQQYILKENSLIEKIITKSSSKLLQTFTYEGIFNEILMSESVRPTTTKKSFKNRLLKILKKDQITDEKNKTIQPQANEIIEFIVESFFNEKGKLKLNNLEQIKFWEQQFDLKKSLLDDLRPDKPYDKLTFIIIPELITQEKDITIEQLIEIRKLWLKEKINIKTNDIEKVLISIVLTDDNFNGMANYYGKVLTSLQKNRTTEIFEAINKIYKYQQEEQEQVLKALEYLSNQSKKLEKPTMPEINSWSEYRINFGKIKSWISNMLKRQKDIIEQTTQFKNNLKELIKEIDNNQDDQTDQKTEVSRQAKQILEIIENNPNTLQHPEQNEVIQNLISELKKKANFYFQKISDNNEESEHLIKRYFNNIYRPASFYGTVILKNNEKIFKNTIETIETGTEFILKHLKLIFDSIDIEKLNDEIELRKTLNFILNKLKTNSVNSQYYKESYTRILIKTAPVIKDIIKNNRLNHICFYKSEYAKGTQKTININGQPNKIFKQLIDELLSLIKQDPTEILKNKEQLLDFLDLSRHLISKLIKLSKIEIINKNDLKIPDSFTKANTYLKLIKSQQITKNEYNYLLQSLILSEIKGFATIYTQELYTAKYTCQFIAIDKKYKLFLISDLLNQDKPNLKDIVANKHNYVITFTKNSGNKSTKALNLIKNQITDSKISEEQLSNALKINSSYYQIQFLDRFLYKPKSWQSHKIKLGEWSLILEKEYKIIWDLNKKVPTFTPTNRDKNRLYISIPFNIEPLQNPDRSLLQIQKAPESLNRPIIGIDVGEYGLAYSVIKVNDQEVEILESDFIIEPNIGKIKDNFQLIQQQARKGLFKNKSDKVAQVRENAAGSLRNKIHNLILKYKPSYIIYEYSISNFETGSGRTTKIYNTVKKSDVYQENNNLHEHIWGKRSKYPGKHVSAYASSYTCAKCKTSLYEISKDDLKDIKIESNPENKHLLKITIGNKTLKAYSQNIPKIGNNKNALKEFQKIVKDFARPPLNKSSSSLIQTNKDNNNLQKIYDLKNKRGNSFLFICPNSDCNFIADADKQASFIMAVRGYTMLLRNQNQTKDESKDTFKETIEFLKNKTIKNISWLQI